MVLEKNPKTRGLANKLLELEDKLLGRPFPKMKRAKQITFSHCGPAVIEDLFSFVGFKVSQAAVVKSIKADKKIQKMGLDVTDLGSAVAKLGKGEFTLWKKDGSTVGTLDSIVNKYLYPVGVEWQGVFYEYTDTDNGHYCVVTRVNKDAGYLRLADPFSKFPGADRRFSLTEFQKRWWDVNIVGKKAITDKKMLFVITPKAETWPKKLGMKRG